MNSIIATVPDKIPNAHVIPTRDCQVKEDDVHFNAEGSRELEKRYGLKMWRF